MSALGYKPLMMDATSYRVYRYLADGSMDEEFSSPLTDASTTIRESEALACGGVLLVMEGNNWLSLTKMTDAGILDTVFGADDRVDILFNAFEQSPHSVDGGANGEIYLAGEADGDFVLVRPNADGSLDTKFGTDGTGYVKTPVGTAGDSGREVLI